MRLFEYETKKILRSEGIPIPQGVVASTPNEAKKFVEDLAKPVILKAQVLVGRRGKAGGILTAHTPQEAAEAAEKLLKTDIGGQKVNEILIEERLNTLQELYLSVAVDDSEGKPVILASSEGGIEVEEIAAEQPEKIVKKHVYTLSGLRQYESRTIAKRIGLRGNLMSRASDILWRLYQLFERYDATIVEVNPLIVTEGGDFFAAGAVMIIDDDSLSRHPNIEAKVELRIEDEIEKRAWRNGIPFARLDGDIGIIGSGAGLAIATIDLVEHYGGKPANFMDTGGQITHQRVKECLEVLMMNPRVRGIIINMYGGINPMVEAAQAIVDFINIHGLAIPIVVKVRGNFEEEAWTILERAGIEVVKSTQTETAAQRIVQKTRGRV